MDFQMKWTDNLILHYAEPLKFNGEGELELMEMSFSFYDKAYSATVTKKSVDSDFASVCGEGHSELFESFIDALEDEHWDKVVETFKLLATSDEI